MHVKYVCYILSPAHGGIDNKHIRIFGATIVYCANSKLIMVRAHTLVFASLQISIHYSHMTKEAASASEMGEQKNREELY